MEIRNGTLREENNTENTNEDYNDATTNVVTEWKQPRMVIDISSSEDAKEYLTTVQSQYWNMPQCQQWQRRFFPSHNNNNDPSVTKRTLGRKEEEQLTAMKKPNPNLLENNKKLDTTKANPHGGGLGKRVQGEHIARFLIASIMHQISTCSDNNTHNDDDDDRELSWLEDPAKWSTWDASKVVGSRLHKQAIDRLNSGSGVLDVAGGSGYVSMALGMMGVKSTVVDARESVGKLPGRDRKLWNRAVKRFSSISEDGASSPSVNYCLPVVPFQAFRAWFGVRPTGVDSTFRHPDQVCLPVCDETSDVLVRASAIVALHPDEATGDIVRLAVHRQIPLVVVPCCVFARLFPNRILTNQPPDTESRVVSSYDDLLRYLKGQDARIRQTELPFDGKNVLLWSTFD
jgi:hypothetical protein